MKRASSAALVCGYVRMMSFALRRAAGYFSFSMNTLSMRSSLSACASSVSAAALVDVGLFSGSSVAFVGWVSGIGSTSTSSTCATELSGISNASCGSDTALSVPSNAGRSRRSPITSGLSFRLGMISQKTRTRTVNGTKQPTHPTLLTTRVSRLPQFGQRSDRSLPRGNQV